MQEIVIGSEQVSVAELIGKGGEGEVYKINNRPEIVVKIYNVNKRSEREGKVRAMVDTALYSKTNLIAYPREIVTDKTGKFLGFVMRFVSGYHPLHELYSPKSRLRHFPKSDYRFLVRAALNVARAVGKVHQDGGVIGDLNHSGILVAQDATIALIDADSFQFYLKGITYHCVVGVPEFTPPELHGKNLALVERTIEHDNFGLAVAIFHLLFMGRHPYAGRYSGPDISMSEAIAQNRFAFSLIRQNETQTISPPGSLTLDLFPDVLAHAFEQAFGLAPGARPNAKAWIQILTTLESSLSSCNTIKTHYYPSKAKGCVWCKLSASSQFDMFPDRSAIFSNIATDASGTEQAIREIQMFYFPTLEDLLPSPSPVKSRSDALIAAKSGGFSRALLGLLMIGGALLGFTYLPSVFYIWIGIAIWGYSFFSNRKLDKFKFINHFKEADNLVQHELDAFLQRNGLIEFIKIRESLDVSIARYKGQDIALVRDLAILKSSRKERQLKFYLDSFSIRKAKISGIGPAKTATLISFGIETAADINRTDVLRVPGFGKVMTEKLLDWRKGKESKFTYNQKSNVQDATDEKILYGQYSVEKVKLENIIRNGLVMLKNAKVSLKDLPSKTRSDSALCKAINIRAQAEHDLKELGLSVPVSSVILPIKPLPQPIIPPSKLSGSALPNRTSNHVRSTTVVPNCPRCGSLMRRRSGKHGPFWGCQNYPRCKGTRN
ncbi:helix-hairpin-helix domain-containing protein [Serratia oryzae]|uniref:Protein kinase domain-containing protein n=1 Tax=Serratia oryzae TaxID=2034155 RepID=A0A1S8CJ27_9GAMM|nr:topoisomerase DNA-binding C4 zinc finger domain-containing protein [Serratia oryzae]OMQ22798.1 hypothetical protein BMI79_10130 [Serratia oryzae]